VKVAGALSLSLSLTYEANETDAEKPVRARSSALPARVVATHATRAGGFGRDERPGSALPSTTYRGIGTRAATHVARSVAGYCFELLRRRGVEVAPRPRDDARREGGLKTGAAVVLQARSLLLFMNCSLFIWSGELVERFLLCPGRKC
jgi:hypothetical protein